MARHRARRGRRPGTWTSAPARTRRAGRHAAAVVDATPPELAAPVGTLVDRIAQVPVELLPVDEQAGAPGPTFEAAQAAAQTVRSAAAGRCSSGDRPVRGAGARAR
ncbi:MAG: hypothetical protein R2711_18080 [Acidimicrobiales bacterium]